MKKIFFAGIIMLLSLSSYAQYTREDEQDSASKYRYARNRPDTNDFWKHVSIGGGFGLQLGTYTYIALSPLFNYHVTEDLVLGVGPMYQYFSYSDGYGTYANTIYGGRLQALYFLPGRLNNIFVQGEYQVLNVPDDYSVFANMTRATISIPLVGAGVRRPIGERSYYTLSALYDISDSPLSPYYWDRLVITFGIYFGM